MTFSEYQKLAARTINSQLKPHEIADHAVCGMVSEIGEFCGIFQKGYQGHEVRPEHLKKELGDLLWFVAEFCTVMDWDFGDIPFMNISKLTARYPDGFDARKSLHRAAGDI
jgi:NTP pyrophosphatase (non-canonical NTP hydrolase)